MAVVKADTYSHGVIKVSKVLQKNGIKGQVLMLGFTPLENIVDLIKYDITQILLLKDYTDNVINTGMRIKCQYRVDTGMNRIGFKCKFT